MQVQQQAHRTHHGIPLSHLAEVAFLAVRVLAVACCAPIFAGAFIAQEGRPRAEIVIAEKPPRMVSLAARELQTYIEKISGAKLPIVTELSAQQPLKVYVGRSAHLRRLGVTAKDLDHGAFRTVSGENWLALVGSDANFSLAEPWAHSRADRKRVLREWDAITGEKWGNPMLLVHKSFNEELDVCEYDQRGSLNAVHEYLRNLGVRWYLPGEEHEIVPKRKTLELPKVNRVVRPDFPVRFLRFYNRFWAASREEILWQLRLGLNPGLEVTGLAGIGHGTVNVHARKETQEKHPEYYALWGKRATAAGHGRGKPCLSSEGLFEQNVKYARAVLDQYQAAWIAVMPADGYSLICQCELCNGKDTPERGYRGRLSDYVWSYVNRVAKELYRSHPDRKVCCFAYGTYLLPPLKIGKLSPNIVVGICQWRSLFHHREVRRNMLALRRAWLEKMAPGSKLMVWGYYLHARPNAYGWDAIPAVFPHLIAEDLRSLKGRSCGDHIETYREHREDGWRTIATNHLNIYVTSRLYWDVDQDVDAMLEEYYRLFYGPAHKEAKAFFEFCEANWFKMKSDVAAIDRMFALLGEARRAADDTVYGQRLDLIAEYTAPLKEKRKEIGKGGRKTYIKRPNAPRAFAEEREKTDIVVDGKLSDRFWANHRKYLLKDCVTGQIPADHRTILMLGWADDALYVALRCYDGDMANLNITAQKDGDEALWFGDSVDILLETHQHAYYQVGLNPAAAMVDADREKRVDLDWSSGAEVATHRHGGRWTAEIRIPVAGPTSRAPDPLQGVDADSSQGVAGSKPSSNLPWFFNVCRQRVREGKEKQLQAFSPTGEPRFHVREKFGELYVK